MGAETHTLILALAPFSDSALVVGPLASRRETRPDETVTFAGVPGACEVIASLGLAETIVETPSGRTGGRGAAGGSKDLVRAARFISQLRRGRYDAVVDLFPRLGSTVASWFAGGARALDPTTRYIDTFFKAKSHVQGSIDPVDRIATLLDVDPDSVGLELHPAAENDHWLERALAATGYAGGPIVAAHTSGRWDHVAFADVVGRLRAAFSALPIALDTPREGGSARQLAGTLGGNVLGLSALSGGRFVAALARASVVVTDDTSVAYLAWLANVPVVLARASSPYRLAPRSGLCVVDADEASSTDAIFGSACELMGQHRTASLFQRG